VTDHDAPIVVTAGEPAGIGPEICLAVAAALPQPDFLIVSDLSLLRERAAALEIPLKLRAIPHDDIANWRASPGELAVVDMPFPAKVTCGKPDTANAAALLEGLRYAIDGCLDGRFSAMVTAPLAKSLINDSGVAFTGHTEFIAERCGAKRPVMLLTAAELRVALATTHLPLREVADNITEQGLVEVLEILHGDLVNQFRIASPDIVVCGLNPHAGEGGHLGHEDDAIIAPVVKKLQAQGMRLRGPLPGPANTQVCRLRQCRERHAGPAHRAHLRRPRHRLRHCRQRHS
jgi:4-hydroxythreonine-4-phosphate dehydrogenase